MEVLKKIKSFFFKPSASAVLQPGNFNPIYNPYVKHGTGNYFQNLVISYRGLNPKICLEVGNDSVINGTYVFENDNGFVSVGSRTFIGGGTFISVEKIEIGDDVLISWGCTFMDNNAHSLIWEERQNDVKDWKKALEFGEIGTYKDWSNVNKAPIKIENKSWIGFNSIILKGVTIGEGAIVAAGSVVTNDVLPWTVVGGNPAREIKKLR